MTSAFGLQNLYEKIGIISEDEESRAGENTENSLERRGGGCRA